ncbi:LacI family DNA-binding transcriptional regulator [Tardiphaga sp. 215_C5_N2_1]|uniref:LacI family DNA-binding transcriptional regulator n=1 Tax=Tardiphaga sp. 215_C5_N2_1 TaxID=3240774 RepID=UPI003F8ABAF8
MAMPKKIKNTKKTSPALQERSSRKTIIDVAKCAGVHWSTVSRGLNPEKRHLISPEMIERVEACAKKLGYRANAMASALRTQRSRTVGVIVSNLGDPVHPPIVRAIEDSFAEIGYVTIVGNTDNHPLRQAALIERFIQQGVEGLIVATFERNDPGIAACVEANIPVVAVFRDPESEFIPSVRVDDAKAMELAVHHLAECGHRQIAHVGGPQNVSTGYHRYRGFRRACKALAQDGVAPTAVFGEAFTVEEGEFACERLLTENPNITAIVAGNDMLAVGCLRHLRNKGISCPGSISLVGMNDMLFMDAIAPALTTVSTPTAELGTQASHILIAMIKGTPVQNDRIVLKPVLLARDSVATIKLPTKARSSGFPDAAKGEVRLQRRQS